MYKVALIMLEPDSSTPPSHPDIVMPCTRRGRVLLVAFLSLIAAGCWPIMMLFNRPLVVAGLPLMALWSYVIVLGSVALMALANHLLTRDDDASPDGDQSSAHQRRGSALHD